MCVPYKFVGSILTFNSGVRTFKISRSIVHGEALFWSVYFMFLGYLASIKSQGSSMVFCHVLAQVLSTLDSTESSRELKKKNSNARTPSLEILMQLVWEWGWALLIFKSSLDESNVQSGLTATALAMCWQAVTGNISQPPHGDLEFPGMFSAMVTVET